MSLDADMIFDRRRLKRALTLWRLLALAALAGLAVVAAGRLGGTGLLARDHVARIAIDGIIFDDAERTRAIKDLVHRKDVKAVIVRVDSPGGTFVGGEALYGALRHVAESKPTVAVMGGTATSAGYMVAIAADHIVARRGTLTGSIGVILQTADVTRLLDKLGIKPEIFKSGPMKAQPNPFESLSDTARKATQDMLMELYGQFVDLVALRRALPREKVLALADGRVYSGNSAKDNGLVDAIGDEETARDWLQTVHGLPRDLPVRDLQLDEDALPWRDALTSQLQKALFSERLRLDGVFSLWHPSL
ncbi:MAG: signal peptide peptidase SppA [Rhodospirillales bacterium CG15_BIG_FIL_POST_REV_8_21_14_020_66_15]|nr:MAG: signal peptide peptidase SppA [Rhodospirillales bacterium CG15_BIG_FIL_POST_REV_8_21_14_020_66_15]